MDRNVREPLKGVGCEITASGVWIAYLDIGK